MRFESRAGEKAEPALGVLIGGMVVTAAALAAVWLHLGLPRPVCFFREWTGLPCPTCGSTRMVDALLSGNVLEALSWNPLVFLGMVVFVPWVLLTATRVAFGLPGWRIVLARRERVGLWIAAAVALVAGWAYLVWRGV